MRDIAWGGRRHVGSYPHPGLVSIDGVQLGGVKRPRLLAIRIARELTETSGAVKNPGVGSRALLNGERGDEQAFRRGGVLHQVLQGFRYLMD